MTDAPLMLALAIHQNKLDHSYMSLIFNLISNIWGLCQEATSEGRTGKMLHFGRLRPYPHSKADLSSLI
jgi:hypothetical protein